MVICRNSIVSVGAVEPRISHKLIPRTRGSGNLPTLASQASQGLIRIMWLDYSPNNVRFSQSPGQLGLPEPTKRSFFGFSTRSPGKNPAIDLRMVRNLLQPFPRPPYGGLTAFLTCLCCFCCGLRLLFIFLRSEGLPHSSGIHHSKIEESGGNSRFPHTQSNLITPDTSLTGGWPILFLGSRS